MPNAAVMSVAVGRGSTALKRMPGFAFAYCRVSMVAAALDAEYSGSDSPCSGRPGVLTAQNDPALLETVTTFGLTDRRSSGSAASVTRTTPTASTSNDRAAAAGP